jgi:hypothetical protein
MSNLIFPEPKILSAEICNPPERLNVAPTPSEPQIPMLLVFPAPLANVRMTTLVAEALVEVNVAVLPTLPQLFMAKDP